MNKPSTPPTCFLATLALVTLTACQGTNRISDTSIQRLDMPGLRQMMADPKQTVVMIDVRSGAQYADRHIPGAINIPLPELAGDEPRLTSATAIVVYGTTWKDDLSAAAAKRLLALEYENVYDFRGGLEQWGKDDDTPMEEIE